MDYQQAKVIRGTKVADLLATAVMDSPSIREAVKKTVSLKLQARTKGLKEKFDPLNIAKFMTFGSKLGPALLGKLIGRNKKDIEYFTGRLKPIRPALLDNADLSLENDGKKEKKTKTKGSNMTAILIKMLAYQQKIYESDRKRHEINSNFEEERKIEAEKRHQKLLEVIEKLGKKDDKSLNIELIKEEESVGLLDKILAAAPLLARILSWPLLPWFLAYTAIPAIAGALFHAYWENRKEKVQKENIEDARQRGGDVAAQAAAEMERLRKEGDEISDPEIRDKMELYQGIRDDAIKRRDVFRDEFFRSSGFRKKNSVFGGYKYVNNKGEEPSAELVKAAEQHTNEQIDAMNRGEIRDPVGKIDQNAAKKWYQDKVAKEKGITPETKSTESPPAPPVTTPAPVSPPKVETTSDASKKLIQSTQENVDANLPAPTPDVPNIVTNVSQTGSGPDVGNNFYVPSVRNQHDTFRSMIYGSTVVV